MSISFDSVLTDGTSATGSEKIIIQSSKKIVSLSNAVDTLLSGDKSLSNKKSLRYIGIIGVLELLNQVDLCNIISYSLGQLSLSKLKPDTALTKNINLIKTVAFNLSGGINKLYTSSNISNPSQGKIFDTELQSDQKDAIRTNFLEIKSIIINNLTPELLSFIITLPGGGNISKTVEDILLFFNTNANITQVPSGQLNQLFLSINTLYSILVAVSSLQSAQSIVSLFPNLQDQIKKVQQQLDPSRILPTLSGILNSLRAITQICNNILKIVMLVQTIAKIIVMVKQVIRVAITIFESNPMPLQFSTAGIVSSLESAKNSLKKKDDELGVLLTEIISLTSILILFITDIVSKVQQMIFEIQKLIITIEQCGILSNGGDDIINQYKTAIKDLQSVLSDLKGFSDTYNLTKEPNVFRFGGYIIKVIDEELVDEGIKNKRRRAVAFDNNGIMVMQGELTFATNTQILVEELKLRLLEAGLITDLSFAITDTIPLNIVNALQLTSDIPSTNTSNTNNTQSINDINRLIDNMKGGKSFKKSIRNTMASQNSDS